MGFRLNSAEFKNISDFKKTFLVYKVLKKFDIPVSIECCPPHVKNVTTLPCEIQNSFATISPSFAFVTASDQGY